MLNPGAGFWYNLLMVDERILRARVLRESGYSIKSIAHQLNAAQSSVSLWVRSVVLTEEQLLALKSNTHNPETIEKRRTSRLKSELAKRTVIIEAARNEIDNISNRELWLIGTALYWAEGAKTQSTVQFSNGDSRMIQLMMRYFREVCMVDERKLRAGIHIHEHLDTKAAELHWQSITSIAKDKFYPTYNKPNKSSKNKRNSLPLGVCDVYVLDARLLRMITGWTIGIYESAMLAEHYSPAKFSN